MASVVTTYMGFATTYTAHERLKMSDDLSLLHGLSP